MRGIRTCYEILGVSPSASAQEIRTAYHFFVRRTRTWVDRRHCWTLVNEAYDTLKDPAQRAQYDAAMRRGANTTVSGSTDPRPPPPRTPQPPPSADKPPQMPPVDVPRSRSGRVPQWVIDERWVALRHLVGLDHVTAASQLMYPQSQPDVTDFGAGDLTGLAAVGRGACLSHL